MDLFGPLVLIAIAAPFFLMGAGLARSRSIRERQRRQRLRSRAGVGADQAAGGGDQEAGTLAALLQFVPRKLRQAGVSARQVRRMTTLSALAFTGGVSYALLQPQAALAGLAVAAAAVASGPTLLVARYFLRRRQLAAQFPQALESMVRALYAGHTVDSALAMLAEHFPPPLGEEFRRISSHTRLGVSLEDELQELRHRVDLEEVHYFVVTTAIQRKTGGPLAPVLADLAHAMRRRALFRGRVRALTAESRFTAVFIGAVPVVYVGYKYLFDRGDLAFFLHDPTGQTLFATALGLLAGGMVLLKLMMRIRF